MTDIAQAEKAKVHEGKEADHHPYFRPRDAATLILVDRRGAVPKVLVGKRHDKVVFMPGKFVFPGGRVDKDDYRVPCAAPITAELEANVARYRRSREHLLAALPAAGFADIAAADGAFYLYADVSARTNDAQAFCARMLAEAGVAASPGLDFDRTRGSRFVRFSYCGPEEDMREAAARLADWR